MKLLNIHGVDDVRLDDYQRPEPGPKDVVVRMKACGICGSDLSYIKIGGIPTPGTLTALGHEGAGEIMHVGSEVTGISVGQPVIINPMNTPSNVGSGGPEGAFTEELLIREARLGDSILPIPDGICYDVAAMCEPLAVAMHGVNRMEVKAGDKAVVFGCGPIGLGMILWLKNDCNARWRLARAQPSIQPRLMSELRLPNFMAKYQASTASASAPTRISMRQVRLRS
jgi:threonine dehydrogenase-like Zn-dependent dehydrogenase